MKVTGWSNGKSTYGIKVGRPNREAFFHRSLTRFVVEVDGIDDVHSPTDAFWSTCPELRSPAIRDWLRRQGPLPWAHRKPPRFTLVPLGEGRFRLEH